MNIGSGPVPVGNALPCARMRMEVAFNPSGGIPLRGARLGEVDGFVRIIESSSFERNGVVELVARAEEELGHQQPDYPRGKNEQYYAEYLHKCRKDAPRVLSHY